MDCRIKQHALGYWEIVSRPTALELQEYYTNNYFQEARGCYELTYANEELVYFEAKLEQRYYVLKALIGEEYIGSMLDVGCGEGFALAFFREKGWAVKGIDFSSSGEESQNPSSKNVLITKDVLIFCGMKLQQHGVTT